MKLFSKSEDASTCVLGLMVAARSLQGVLLERDEHGTRVVRHLTRPRRNADGGGGFQADLPAAVPEETADEASGSDFTIQFGGGDGAGGAGGGDLFLGSEFGDLGGGAGAMGGAHAAPVAFDMELTDMLNECRDAGYDDVEVAFCLQASDVARFELHIVDEADKEGAAATVGTTSEKKLFKLLEAQHDGAPARERTAFLPMTPTEEGVPRYMALIGEETDPVVTTLRVMRDEDSLPAVRMLDTEVSLYLGLARAAQSEEEPAEGQGTLVVRAGADDTFVLFMQNGVLEQCETLPLTAHDAPETICSRVLLLQDEYGIGEVGRVLLMSDDLEDEFAESFEMFFADARVSALRDYLPGQGSDEAFEAPGAIVPATGVALRLARHAGYRTFDDVNLLSKSMLRRRFKMPVSTTSLALGVLLLCVVAFFAFRYMSLASEIDERQQRLEALPTAEVDADPRRVQAAIDSLQAISNSYMRGLEVLDELLMGSDKWSQALAEVSNETAAVRGVWVDAWTPRQTEVELSGSATTRDRIVNLAERTGGSIESITFSEVREWPVYSFTMTMPLEMGLPEATRYLRDQAMAENTDSAGETISPQQPRPSAGDVAPAKLTEDDS